MLSPHSPVTCRGERVDEYCPQRIAAVISRARPGGQVENHSALVGIFETAIGLSSLRGAWHRTGGNTFNYSFIAVCLPGMSPFESEPLFDMPLDDHYGYRFKVR